MTTINLKTINRMYKNNGQHAEQTARFTLTGKIEKADNRPHNLGGDIGNLQVKSARATVCTVSSVSVRTRSAIGMSRPSAATCLRT